jgi:Uma2 family endonuclease
VALPPFDEPEPDAAIVRGAIKDYRDHKPGPGDILCVIEVADASLRRDRATKQRIYADAGIAEYLIVNLPDRVIEVYTEPHKGKGRYGQLATLTATKRLAVSVAQILG